MIKLILMVVWWPDKFHAAEINIEGLEVKAIERIGHNTVVGFMDNRPVYKLRCSITKHNELVERFRKKLKLAAST